MPIEFQCNNCQNVLKVGDEHAGKSARCPSCKTVTSIPLSSELLSDGAASSADQPTSPSHSNPFSDSQLESEQSAAAASNPYQSPTATKLEGRPLKGGTIVPTAVGFDDIFNYAWRVWKENLGLLVAAAAILLGTQFVMSYGPLILEFVLMDAGVDQITRLIISWSFNLINFVINTFLAIGFARICLQLARRQPAAIGDLFSGIDKFLPALGANLLFMIAMIAGLLFLIVPGILVGLYFWPYFQLIADRKTGAIESFSVASQIAKLNIGTSFVIGLVMFALALLGMISCCVGLLFTMPLYSLVVAVAYLKMSGQI